MKPEELIRLLKDPNDRSGNDVDMESVMEMIIQALEKQVAKKPTLCGENPNGTYHFKCPICGRLWWEKSYITKYCDGCGNKVDRGKE